VRPRLIPLRPLERNRQATQSDCRAPHARNCYIVRKVLASPFKLCLGSALVCAAVLAAGPQDQSPDTASKHFAVRGASPEVDVGDPRLNKTLSAVVKQASLFWEAAPNFTAHETVTQKAVVRQRRTVHFRQLEPPPDRKNLKEEAMASYYGFSALSTAPEALREFRRIISVGAKQVENPAAAREKLERVLAAKDDGGKQALRRAFEKENPRGAAIDFGQLILLFIRSRMAEYSFAFGRAAMLGKDAAQVVSFQQTEGSGAIRISEPGRKLRIPLHGELWVRQDDDRVLRITLTVGRNDEDIAIRDEASVDYLPNPSGAILPGSVLYRRFLNDKLYFENTYQYSDWRAIGIK
jgi:hypothetical protein